MPVKDPFGVDRQVMVRVDLDDELLQRIAIETGAKYWRATDTQSLKQIFSEINKLEKTEAPKDEVVEYQELYVFFLVPAAICLFSSLWLNSIVWKELP